MAGTVDPTPAWLEGLINRSLVDLGGNRKTREYGTLFVFFELNCAFWKEIACDL